MGNDSRRDQSRFVRWLLDPIGARMLEADRYFALQLEQEVRRWHRAVGWPRSRLLEMHERLTGLIPDLEPLLSGVAQPADFVKHWIQGLENRTDETLVLYEVGPDDGEDEQEAANAAEVSQARKRWVFDLAVAREDLRLRAWLGGVNARHLYRVVALVAFNLVIFAFLLVLRLSQGTPISTTSISDLKFVSLLLAVPVVSLFAYSRLIYWTHQDEQEGRTLQIRLAAATHAYETYQEVQRLRGRVGAREREAAQRASARREQALAWEEQKTEVALQRMLQYDEVASQIRKRKAREMREFLLSVAGQPHIPEQAILKALELWLEGGEEGLAADLSDLEGSVD